MDGRAEAWRVPGISWLGEEPSRQVPLVGGKAAQLSRLSERYRVPPGFCLTTTALMNWPEDVCPDDLRDQLRMAHAELCQRLDGVGEPWLAVRSSGIEEDGQEMSFAGQFETVLGVRGLEALCAAVTRCRESAFSERVRTYRHSHGLACSAPLAVLVQVLVPADVSFVAFSANPLTGENSEVMINASWGLGESIVGGTTTPDTYVVRGNEMHSRQIGAKEHMTVLCPNGTREVAVPRLLRERPCLTDVQAVEIAAIARRLDIEHGWPVDIEGAFYGGTLHLLQCRPITTLNAAP